MKIRLINKMTSEEKVMTGFTIEEFDTIVEEFKMVMEETLEDMQFKPFEDTETTIEIVETGNNVIEVLFMGSINYVALSKINEFKVFFTLFNEDMQDLGSGILTLKEEI